MDVNLLTSSYWNRINYFEKHTPVTTPFTKTSPLQLHFSLKLNQL